MINHFINKDFQEIFIDDKYRKLNHIKKKGIYTSHEKCYNSFVNPNLRIIHFIITRFIIEFWKINNYHKKIYTKDYIINGIRVMKKYLIPSLEYQSCKDFIWILMLGNRVNLSDIENLADFNTSFKYKILNINSVKKYMRDSSKLFDILITTRIDYDDRIYYDAVNDVRKAININRPLILYGYNRGVYYFETDDKYYEFYNNFNNTGTMSIFCSLIIVLNKVNDTYNIYDLGGHPTVRKQLLESYRLFGVKKLNYDPGIFDNGSPKFVWVRQKFSGMNYQNWLQNNSTKEINFNLNSFYGK